MLQRVFQFGLIASLFLAVATASANPQTESNGEIIEHTIEQGQFLNRIAAQYNTTVAKILELNPGLDPDKIQTGQKIKVPASASSKAEKPATEKRATEVKSSEVVEHTIVSGDSFGKLAGKYNTTSAKIQELNPGLDPTKLQIGQKIKVPANGTVKSEKPTTEKAPEKVAEKTAEKTPEKEAAPAAEKPSTETTTSSKAVVKSEYIEHTVAAGEKFSHIVVKYRTTTVRILKHNPGLEPAKVRPGQKIRIPVVAYKKPETESQTKPEPKKDTKTEASSSCTYHTIESGDSFGRLAGKYNTTSAKIQELNPGLDPTRLQIGQKVRVK